MSSNSESGPQPPELTEKQLLRLAQADLADGAPLGVATLKELAKYAKDEKVRYLASVALLEATGLKSKGPSTIGFNFSLPATYLKQVASGLSDLSGARVRRLNTPDEDSADD